MPVAIQQSPEKCCTNLVHYSFLHQKSARKQVVSGEKSPSWDGLKVPRQLKDSIFFLLQPRGSQQEIYGVLVLIKRCSTAQTLPGAESCARGHLLRDAA
ncbi:hypothetical protein CF017_15445 [Citrobacter braakii]|nr:hypothetical protein [Citrobacter braakii]POZ46462.1 hypothetical protein CF017_15445 [Citrobacter braakii]TCC69531.1 hypothetical protein EY920_14480 [Citrobacter braakii]TCC69855.1 hypothetical protein EY917_16855 [Citrobacter braakii]TCC81566.1 hypothetical protein EY915_11855 [Citrobacter braakii]